VAVTIRDVAKLAGVSFKTVSNVVNDFPHVAPATRERVLAAIDELGYRPNQAARHLRHGTSGFLGLVLPDVVNPYFSTLASLVGQSAKKRGWAVVIEETGGETEREQEAVDELSSRLVDGVILSPISTPSEAIEARLGSTPIVLLGERAEDVATDHVGIDNARAGRLLTEHLIAAGARRIAAIGYRDDGVGTGGQRWVGHVQALQAAGLPVRPGLAVQVPAYDRPQGARAMRELLDRDPDIDGVIGMNDLLALGALRALHDHGAAVPEQVMVAGFDDSEDGRFAHPRLTSVSPDLTLLAHESVTTLLRRIKEPTAEPRHVRIPFTIAARESTARR
jgi:DNA-binding LacI/PurR family transcriptional regulator